MRVALYAYFIPFKVKAIGQKKISIGVFIETIREGTIIYQYLNYAVIHSWFLPAFYFIFLLSQFFFVMFHKSGIEAIAMWYYYVLEESDTFFQTSSSTKMIQNESMMSFFRTRPRLILKNLSRNRSALSLVENIFRTP